MDIFRWRMLKKEKKIFCKQFVRIKRNLLTTEPTKYGLKFSVSVYVNQKRKKSDKAEKKSRVFFF